MSVHLEGMLVGGVDEAGRGSILGPLVVAGISVRESRLAMLRELGVRDSKLLTPKSRAKLFGKLVSIAESVSVIKIPSSEVDESVFVKGLNRLEAKTMAQAINDIGAEEVYVDCCDTSTERYKENLCRYLVSKPSLYSLHHADSVNIVVSAASIVAKITRDQEIKELRKTYRDIGSGYPSDEKTMRFLRRWVSKNGSPPHFARRSWKPLRAMLEAQTQKTLVRLPENARIRPTRGTRSI